jgi:quercetin dioxygenase-like cupin family protein
MVAAAGGPPGGAPLSRDFLGSYLADLAPRVPYRLLDDPSAWHRTLVAESFPPGLREPLTRLHAEQVAFVRWTRAAPPTLAHHDVWPNNLFATGEGFVLIDWAFAGAGSLGQDPGNLVLDSVWDLLMPAALLPKLDEAVLTGYLEGLRWAGWDANYEKTPILAACPYLEEIVDEFECPKERVRLLRLEPGKNINTHTDLGDGWAMGKVRLHIPIITNPEVYFYVDDERVIMNPGELWYCDFTHPHRVHNRGDQARVHLVLDLRVNDWLRDFFPAEPLRDKVKNAVQLGRYRARYFVDRALRAPALAPLRSRAKAVLAAGKGRLRRS